MKAASVALLFSLAAADSKTVERIDVTSGSVETVAPGKLKTQDPVMRGTFPEAAPGGAELRFTYEGPTTESRPLASGEVRRQLGLKLRAMDSCNVLYVMWHLEPTPKVEVSLKRNPNLKEHRECGDRGYLKLSSEIATRPPPPVHASEHHTLRVEDRGQTLEVWIDGESMWRGALPEEAKALQGPAGIRSDNVRFSFEALTIQASSDKSELQK